MILCKSLQHGRKCDHIVVWLQASSSADVFEDSQFEIEALANSVVFLAVRIHLCHHGRFLAVQCCSSSRVWLLGRLLKVVLLLGRLLEVVLLLGRLLKVVLLLGRLLKVVLLLGRLLGYRYNRCLRAILLLGSSWCSLLGCEYNRCLRVILLLGSSWCSLLGCECNRYLRCHRGRCLRSGRYCSCSCRLN